jgi:aminocarboxymuconate-semialdehyde decarboxylase
MLAQSKLKIDLHNHFYPPEYLQILEKSTSWPFVEKDEIGRLVIVDKGVRVVTITDEMYQVERRLKDMDRYGVDMQVLTLSIPGVDRFDATTSVSIARRINDSISEVVKKYPSRFSAFAVIPLKNIPAALDEMNRAINDLGMRGVTLQSNVDGKPLDNPEFLPIFEKAAKMGMPISIHPGTPLVCELVAQYRLGPMVGFLFDTTLAMLRLILSGVLEKIPNVTFILSHLGGMLPFIVNRLDRCYEAYPEARVNLSKPISAYLKKAYYDTVSFYKPAVDCTLALVGSKGLVFGSDYPHVIGSLDRAVKSISSLSIPDVEKQNIFGDNAAKLLRI